MTRDDCYPRRAEFNAHQQHEKGIVHGVTKDGKFIFEREDGRVCHREAQLVTFIEPPRT